MNRLGPRNKHHTTNVTKTCWQGTWYKNKAQSYSVDLCFSRHILLCLRKVPSHFFMICGYLYTVFNVVRMCFLFSINGVHPHPHFLWLCGYLYIVFNVVRMCFLFSINDIHPHPLSSPGELSSRFLLFSSYFVHDQRTPCFKQLPCINDEILFN